MTVAHVATAATLRAALADADANAEALRAEVDRAQGEVTEVTRAGAAVLAALEAAMVPLMAELALTRQACKEYCVEQGMPFVTSPEPAMEASKEKEGKDSSNTIPVMEAEHKHLLLDIDHFQHKAERLQIEERQRSHEISRLCGELCEAGEHLSYEQQCVKHHEVCRQFGIEVNSGWAGMGPCGIGRRTLEVRAEKKLRECAEQRGGRLARDVTKLASDTTQQQASIAQLGRRLKSVRQALSERDKRLRHNQKHTALLHTKLKVTSDAGGDPSGQPTTDGEQPDAEVNGLGGVASASAPLIGEQGGSLSLQRSRKKGGSASSTGKLPQLSF